MADNEETSAPVAAEAAASQEETVEATQEEQAPAEDKSPEESAAQETEGTSENQEAAADDADAADDDAADDDAAAAAGESTAQEEAPTEEGEGKDADEDVAAAETTDEPAPAPESEQQAVKEQETQPEAEPEPAQEPDNQQEAQDTQSEVAETEQNGGQEEVPQVTPEEQEQEAPPVAMSEEKKERYRRIFERKATNGRVDLRGLKLLFRLLGEVLSACDADKMFECAVKDENSTIDFEEFCRLHAKFSQEEMARKQGMMDSIDKLFPNSNGQPVELKKVEMLLLKLQQPSLDMRLVREKSDLNANDVRMMIRSMDKSGTGLISKQDFVDTLCRHLDMEA